MLAFALSQRGKPYVWGGKNGRPGYDCSGLVAAATAHAGRQLAGGSKQQFATCKNQGRLISVAEGLRTRGAVLFRMTGDPTHVAFSLGDGSTMEARGKSTGVNVFGGAAKRTWTHAAIWI
ncbi:C40 family peptidase [Kineococcus terrestris]|uniref:C40 family peptidase n=1 Tax=Kineococcus terrestris TaxID=2044856 RepID=UPI0034DAE1D2